MRRFRPQFLRRAFSTPAAPRQLNVLCMEGDGVGPELVSSTKEIISAALDSESSNLSINYVNMPFGYNLYQSKGYAMNEDHVNAFIENKVILKGPVTIPPGDTSYYIQINNKQYTSPNQALRKIFQLFANVRPAKSCPIGTSSSSSSSSSSSNLSDLARCFQDLDIVVVRENTEDLYSGEEYFYTSSAPSDRIDISSLDLTQHKFEWNDINEACAIKRITRKSALRAAEFSRDYALRRGRTRVTAVHKGNVNKFSDGLWLDCHRNVFAREQSVEYNEQLADSLLYKLMISHEEFDVLSCPNLYGDLVSDLLAGMIGSLGLMPAAHVNEEYALFEPTHGSAPDIAGMDAVNPISQWRSAAMMFEHVGELKVAEVIEDGVQYLLRNGIVTRDLGGQCGTREMTKALVEYLIEGRKQMQ